MLKHARTLLITGASQGIGRELSLLLAQQGHTVIAVARHSKHLDSLIHPNIQTQVLDLADTQSLVPFVAQLCLQHPRLSGVIHNAAIQIEKQFVAQDYDAQLIDQEVKINLIAPMVLTHALLPHLLKQADAFVCGISSILALAPKRSSAVYCATKSGLHNFLDSLRAQLSGTHIQIIEVLPPTVDTRMTQHRAVPKMTAHEVAVCTVQAIHQKQTHCYPGKAKILLCLLYIAPWFAKRFMLRF